ncbi:GNAT family N-acetyltransferase [Psychromonas sp. KJ10-10]|uniref:GNAT family N-acetyltransferase n=1 Tax=Psychromonas sp. KJ10-10 TaxID=3391823 RepID=UPI0039B55972
MLETNRLLLRQLTTSDIKPLSLLLCDPEVMRYSVNGVMDEKATFEFVTWCQTSYVKSGFGPWAIIDKNSNKLLGFSGLNEETHNNQTIVNLGYRLGREHWNKGYATEAVCAVLEYAFIDLKIAKIVAIVEPENIGSNRIIEKLGFNTFDIGEYHKKVIHKYTLSKAQWRLV